MYKYKTNKNIKRIHWFRLVSLGYFACLTCGCNFSLKPEEFYPIEVDVEETLIPKDETKEDLQEIVVVCGNPGAGKSTLLNIILGKDAFESGISVEKGLTQRMQLQVQEGIGYIDTPGLADVKSMQIAAQEIKKALQQNKPFKLVFVLSLGSGRITTSDLETINMICEAIQKPVHYGIVLNKVPSRLMKAVDNIGIEKYMANCFEQTNLMQQPKACYLMKYENSLEEDEYNAYLKNDSRIKKELLEFISSIPANEPLGGHIQMQDIDVNDYKAIEKQLRREEVGSKVTCGFAIGAVTIVATSIAVPPLGIGLGATTAAVLGAGVVGGVTGVGLGTVLAKDGPRKIVKSFGEIGEIVEVVEKKANCNIM